MAYVTDAAREYSKTHKAKDESDDFKMLYESLSNGTFDYNKAKEFVKLRLNNHDFIDELNDFAETDEESAIGKIIYDVLIEFDRLAGPYSELMPMKDDRRAYNIYINAVKEYNENVKKANEILNKLYDYEDIEHKCGIYDQFSNTMNYDIGDEVQDGGRIHDMPTLSFDEFVKRRNDLKDF